MSETVCTVNRVDNGFIVSNGQVTAIGTSIEQAIKNFYSIVDSKNDEPYKHGLTRAQYSAVVSLIKEGKFIEGIKEIRSITGLGLREAKDIADEIRNNL